MTPFTTYSDPRVDFRKAVESRCKSDLIMSALVVIMLSLIPVLLLAMFVLMCYSPTPYNRLNEYRECWIVVTVMMEFLILGIITRMMYTRLMDHSERDVQWRWALISYASSCGADTRELIAIHEEIIEKEKFRVKIPLIILSTLLFVLMVFIIICVIPELMLDTYESANFLVRLFVSDLLAHNLGTDEQSIIALVLMPLYALLLIPMIVIASVKVLGFPAVHARNQARFTEELSGCLRRKGVYIPPMIETIRHRPFIHHILFTVITGGLYLIYMMFWVFRGMNTHLMNQWVYEAEMLEFMETDGRRGFDDILTYHRRMSKKMSDEEHRHLMVNIRRQVRRENRKPYPLIVAEMFVIATIVMYILSIVASGCEIVHDYGIYRIVSGNIGNIGFFQWINMLMVVVNLYLFRNTIHSLLCIGSRRPDSWRKVTISCIMFLIPLWVNYLINSNSLGSMFNLNPFVATGIVYNVLLIMILSNSIRDFYKPIKRDMPELKDWILYLTNKDKGGFP